MAKCSSTNMGGGGIISRAIFSHHGVIEGGTNTSIAYLWGNNLLRVVLPNTGESLGNGLPSKNCTHTLEINSLPNPP